MSRYQMECPTCGGSYIARKMDNGDYMCLNCFSVEKQSDELRVVDLEEYEKYKTGFGGKKEYNPWLDDTPF